MGITLALFAFLKSESSIEKYYIRICFTLSILVQTNSNQPTKVMINCVMIVINVHETVEILKKSIAFLQMEKL